MRGFMAVGLLLSLTAVMWYLGMGTRRRPDSSPRFECQRHLRQVGLGLQIYSNENHRLFPPALETLITEDILTSDTFVCPATVDERATGPTTQALVAEFRRPGHNSYIYVGAGATDRSESSVVLAYEPIANHGHGMNVLYVDGHADWVSEPEASRVIAELNAGFNPPRPPTTQPSAH